MADNDDKKVKDLIDDATRADLERWFGLPSFEQLADRGIAPAPPPVEDDPVIAEAQKRQAAAIAAVDPAMLEAHRRRTTPPDDLLRFRPSLELRIDPEFALLDLGRAAHAIAEPRSVERPSDIEEELQRCAPQALLRDLHRPELFFDKTFEISDPIQELRFDSRTEAAREMATPRIFRMHTASLFQEGRALLREARELRYLPWQPPNRPEQS